MTNENQKDLINRICKDFEAQWKQGECQPLLFDLLAGENKSLGTPLLEELLKLDIHYRQKNSQDVVPIFYSALGPEAVEIAESILIGMSSEDTVVPDFDAAR